MTIFFSFWLGKITSKGSFLRAVFLQCINVRFEHNEVEDVNVINLYFQLELLCQIISKIFW